MKQAAMFALSVASSVVGAYGAHQSGKAAERAASRQAAEEEARARIEALEAREKGVEELRKINAVLAANTARGAAGNLNPFSPTSSIAMINNLSLDSAVSSYYSSLDNAIIAHSLGKSKAERLRYAGKMKKRAGNLMAAQTLLQGGSDAAASGYDPFASDTKSEKTF
jgi:hypothetical protein